MKAISFKSWSCVVVVKHRLWAPLACTVHTEISKKEVTISKSYKFAHSLSSSTLQKSLCSCVKNVQIEIKPLSRTKVISSQRGVAFFQTPDIIAYYRPMGLYNSYSCDLNQSHRTKDWSNTQWLRLIPLSFPAVASSWFARRHHCIICFKLVYELNAYNTVRVCACAEVPCLVLSKSYNFKRIIW